MTADAHGKFNVRRLVVFGCGYVGAKVARQALARGLRVTVLTRNEAKAAVLRDEGIEVVVAELSSPAWHERIAGGAELVLNCVSSGGGDAGSYRRSYVDGMASILAWARASAPVGTMVYTSSTSVYPQGGGAVVDEASPTGGDERAEVLLEAEARLRAEGAGCRRWFILRLAGIYGPGRHHVLSQVRAGEIAGRADHRLNLAHREDIAAAVWACFDAPASVANETFNVADDAPAKKREVAAWLAERLGLPEPRFTGEAAPGRRGITPDRTIVNERLKRVLGWQPRHPSFREGYASFLSR
jgi:nucleoside-diphosphate-sugar epimerase